MAMNEMEAIDQLKRITGMSDSDLQMTINIRYQGLDNKVKLGNMGKPIPVIVLENCFGNSKEELPTGPSSLSGYTEETKRESESGNLDEKVAMAENALLGGDDSEFGSDQFEKQQAEKLQKQTTLIFTDEGYVSGIRIGNSICIVGMPDTVPDEFKGRTFQRHEFQIRFEDNGEMLVTHIDVSKSEEKLSCFLDDKGVKL